MTVKKRRKNSRLRGSNTHAWGSKKKHRGAGNRGGRGNAGRGKRSDHKRPSFYQHGKNATGKRGFTMHGNTKKVTAVNVGNLEVALDRLVAAKKVEKKEGTYIVHAAKVGFQKILGSGNIQAKVQVHGFSVTTKAEEKIKKAGGQVVLSEAQ